MELAAAGAESSLREGNLEAAGAHYRAALLEAWMLRGALAAADGKGTEAREAFREASLLLAAAVERDPRDLVARRRLAQAQVAAGDAEEAARTLEAGRAAAPDDLELLYALGAAYLRVGKAEAAAPLFAELARHRPLPQTHVLIGRTYRDAGQYARARAELEAALAQDPRARRAHYYLGMVTLAESGTARLDQAIAEFRAELALEPGDPLANLQLGMALAEERRCAEALGPLEAAAAATPPQGLTLYYLGRCQLALERPAEACSSLGAAADMARARKADPAIVRAILVQLGPALRGAGRKQEADAVFAELARLSARGAETERETMARYLADVPDPEAAGMPGVPLAEASRFAGLPAGERAALAARLTPVLARAYLNLGIMEVQGERFAEAALLLEKAAAVDADFPGVQRSLGVAYFNAKAFDKAAPTLRRALAEGAADADVRRMLVLALLNTDAFDEAAGLLRSDPRLVQDPALQLACGLALMRGGRPADAVEHLAAAARLAPGDGNVRYALGRAYQALGRTEEAEREFEVVRRLAGEGRPDPP
jgi:tetratricopeptide (TPR) repeat protein